MEVNYTVPYNIDDFTYISQCGCLCIVCVCMRLCVCIKLFVCAVEKQITALG